MTIHAYRRRLYPSFGCSRIRRLLPAISALATCLPVVATARADDDVRGSTTWCTRVEVGPGAAITTVLPERPPTWTIGHGESTARGLMLRGSSSLVATWVKAYRHPTFRIGDFHSAEAVLG